MNFDNDIQNCLKVLKTGGIILYPTDTIWGLGCDATNKKAVAKIYALKQRAENKSMILLLANNAEIATYCKTPSAVIHNLLRKEENPLTIVYPNAKNIAENLISENGTVAIRIVKDAFCEALINAFGKPIVSTSANIAGETSPTSYTSVNAKIKKGADYIVQHRRNENNFKKPSKILSWKNDEEILIIRE
jgi:L-threonylcarbamoyladenylate synthase